MLLDYKPRVPEQMTIGYIEHLRDKGRAPKTISLHVAAILHFFEMNDIVLNKRKITRFIPPDVSAYYSINDKVYTLEEIHRILEASDERTKVIVLLMASTGMRIVLSLTCAMGIFSFLKEHNLYKIQVYATSRKHTYFTYCTPECKVAIDAYLDYRRRLGETIEDKSPLIRELFNSKKPYFVEAPRATTTSIIQRALEKALQKAGINQRPNGLIHGKRRAIARSHGFRKFVIAKMDKAGVKDTHRRYLTGHAHIGEDRSYVLPTDEDLLSEYIKAIPLLTIDPTQRLENENQELKTEKNDEIARLMERRSTSPRYLLIKRTLEQHGRITK